MSDKQIKRIDNWPIKSYLGEGAYAYAYEVDDDEKSLVLKWMVAHPGDVNAPKRFTNEIFILKSLNHPAIPKYHSDGVFNGRPYIVMSKAPGKILTDILDERRKEGPGTALGEIRVIAILKKILEVLQYLHGQGVHHRDLKDDNILSNESDTVITIIDFGVCEGESMPENILTFRGGVGSARFCPPQKIKLGKSKPSHDIFAVGVIGYLLLTGEYPWEVPPDKNVLILADLMLSMPHKRVLVYNPKISKATSDLIDKLIVVEDEHRLCAQEAVKLIDEIQEAGADPVTTKVIKHPKLIFPHVTLDPVHKDIRLTSFEWQIINSKEFQRLRLIKQLGFTNLVYFGADHSRFSHAVGTLHVVNKIINAIEDKGDPPFSKEEKLAARCYALVHDITHITFGHTLEDELNFFNRHDENRSRLARLVFSEDSEIGNLLRKTDYGREILKYLDVGELNESTEWISEITESSFGADVLDYIDRDAFYCGLDHKVDSAIYRRVSVKNSTKSNQTEKHFMTKLHGDHGYRLDADFAIESIFRERYALFMKVYTHPVKISASAMLGKCLVELVEHKNKSQNKSVLNGIEWAGDVQLLTSLSLNGNKTVEKIAKMILARKLFKPIFRAQLVTHNDKDIFSIYEKQKRTFEKKGVFDPLKRKLIEGQLAAKAKIDSGDVIIYCAPQAPGIKKIQYFVETKPGHTTSRDDSAQIHMDYMRKHLGLWFIYVFVNPAIDDDGRRRLSAAATNLFGLNNDIEIPLRELQLQLPFESQ